MTTRRRFLGSTTAAAAAATLTGPGVSGAESADDDQAVFRHGVASGDPLHDRVILWTRISGQTTPAVPVHWRIATDPAGRNVVNQGVVSALAERDYTLKLDSTGLQPGQTYYYQFEASGQQSPVGRTRTLPEDSVTHLQFAVVSCSNLPFGYFNAYARIAERDQLNAVLHLGDYFYEYAPGQYGDGSELGRAHEPPRETVSLADYRIRHAQYKTDSDLQAAHQQHPWICVWDDHESTNNSWRDGAQNHDPDQGEGDWSVRKAAAVRAYHEWMPIRDQFAAAGPFIYRSFRFGNLADLIMLDTRLHGRSRQLDERTDADGLADTGRTILGADQHAWLAEQLRASVRADVQWRVFGQQLMFGQLIDDDGLLLNLDQWDGYPFSRAQILDQLEAEQIDNVVVVTGDIHTAWALDIARNPMSDSYDAETGKGSLAVELVTTSVTSPGPKGEPEALIERERTIVESRPHMKYVNLREHGYLLLDIDNERARGEFWFVERLLERGGGERLAAAYQTQTGANHLVKARS